MKSAFNHRVVVLTFYLVISIIATSSSSPIGPNEEFPEPPPKPEKFNSKAELREYLVKLFTYYSIIERPRFGRRAIEDLVSSLRLKDSFENASNMDGVPVKYLILLIDENRDGFASGDEIFKFVDMFQQSN